MVPSSVYLRVEAVNLKNFVDDVHDLSTIRGGSLLLIEAIDRIKKRFKLEPITTGASSGLFIGAIKDPDALRLEVQEFLRSDPQLKHATFVVDAIQHEGEYVQAREALTALNRWQQWQQPTVAVPSRAKPAAEACDFDLVRPAITKMDAGEHPASASVFARRAYGREQRSKFYVSELKKLEPRPSDLLQRLQMFAFVDDLAALTLSPEEDSLSLKMAIIYLDGNRFGRIQREQCTTRRLHNKFDEELKTHRRNALRALLQHILDRPSGWLSKATTTTPSEGAPAEIRLQTLLWGGDELIWVVPAWKAWETLALFYEVSRAWEFDAGDGSAPRPLTHAGGVVFCHQKAPIHKIRDLAKSLADRAKRLLPGDLEAHGTGDCFAYQVLESFDYVASDLDGFRLKRVPKGRLAEDLIVRANGMREMSGHFETLKRGFPRSKLHMIVQRLLHGGLGEAAAVIASTEGAAGEDAQKGLKALLAFFDPAGTGTGFLHIADLWDYVGDEASR